MVNSIAFYPAIIAFLFLLLSALSIAFDFSEEGKEIKSRLQWLRLKDPSTARSIIASIAAGIISLTVFSFSMVMIVLNQTASQMSNRILDKLIGSRFQQVVLGVYVGTIVYALFLLSTIRNVDSGIHIPALSTYLLIGLTICNIFLFIYFLHYITQSVKYDVIIKRIYEETLASMKSSCSLKAQEEEVISFQRGSVILASKSGVYEGFSAQEMLALCEREQCVVITLHAPGTFIMEGIPLAEVNTSLPQATKELLAGELFIHQSESIKGNFFYGFRQLSEVALKALSPGINDPGTAVQVMRALFELYAYRIAHAAETHIRNGQGLVRIVKKELTFEEIFEITLMPIWDYGKADRMIRNELRHLLNQLTLISPRPEIAALLASVDLAISMHVKPV
jgi:uncharacterized membrane protein